MARNLSLSLFSALFMVLFSQFVSTRALALKSPPLTIKSLEGASLADGKAMSVSLAETNSKGTVVVFLSSVCPCSGSHIPVLKSLADKFKEFKFVGVHSNSDESLSSAEIYFRAQALPFLVIQDQNAKLADAFKAFKTPHAFVVNSVGEILYQGGVTNSSNSAKADRNFLEEALTDLQAGLQVRTPEGRTLGCVISREGEKNVW